MPQERLGGHKSDGCDVGQPCLVDAVLDVEEELVGGTEAGAALGGADHDRAGVLQEAVPRFAGQLCALAVRHIPDGVHCPVAADRPRPGLESLVAALPPTVSALTSA